MSKYPLAFILMIALFACRDQTGAPVEALRFTAVKQDDQILILPEAGKGDALVTQNARPDHRPYLHPILAPDSSAPLTQYSPGHHKHQTGLYWGFTRVNGSGAPPDTLKKWFYRKDKPENIRRQIGRDFFHHPEGEYWRRVSAEILIPEGKEVKWQTVYHLLDEAGEPLLEETQIWTFSQREERYLLDLEWRGKALQKVTVNEFDYGGLFLRMPWEEGIQGEVINAARQRNDKAEGQRAMWVDVGMEIDGLDEWGHIAIFDHPDNEGFPQSWRVDGQLGVGPVRARTGDWTIPAGETEVIRHQLVAYTGELSDIKMNEWWAEYVGDDGIYNTASLWGIAQEEGYAAQFLTPEAAIAEMTVKDGYAVNVFASEPMITQPMAFCWDDRGRLWIAENRDYESRGYGFSNSGDSRILILEDTDRDGQADKQTVFLEGIPFPSAIAVGFDGLFLGAPPNLLFVPDKDQDDRADEADIQVLLTGWGIRDRHETINSFHWGPDGWLYGLEGFATPSKIRKPKGEGRIYRPGEAFPKDLLDAEGTDINGGVWRYHPVKERFEVVAHGFSNPWGIDYDAKGQLFISACVIPHLFHIIPGGIYHRQGGRHFNPYVYRDIRTIVDHRHRSAHGGARIYQSDAFPPEQQGRLFMANIHEHAVLSDVLTPNGSGFTAGHGEDFMLANNAQWIGFSLEIGPEGGLYVLDWHDADICGKEVRHKETGRVFRIMPEKSQARDWPGRYEDLRERSDEQLVDLQWQTSDWHARRSRIILQHRAAEGNINAAAVSALTDHLQNDPNGDYRLRALWTLHITNQLTTEQLLALLEDRDPYLRGWAVQFLCEDHNASAEVRDQLVKLAAAEEAPVVRLYLAAALQRLEPSHRWELAKRLVTYAEDADDPNIPFMLWFGIEPLAPADPDRVLALAADSRIPGLTQHIARRLVDAGELKALTAALPQRGDHRLHLLTGMLAGLEGKTDLKAPPNWESVYNELRGDDAAAETALLIAQRFGSAAAAASMLAELQKNNGDIAQQQQAIQLLSARQHPELLPQLPALLEQSELRIDAIRAIANYQQEELGNLLLEKYPSLPVETQREVILALAGRPVYGRLLTRAIADGSIGKEDIPPYVALQLRRVVGNGFVEIWGPIDEVASDKQAEYAKYQRLLRPAAIAGADPLKGKVVYQRSCGACHKMYGEGGALGPELTGSNRTNTAYLLSNILEPSSEIQDDYRMVVITTRDGRTFSGNIIAEDAQQISLRVVGQDEVRISRSNIQSREVSPNSMMPEGLLRYLTDEEVLNLIAFLQTEGDMPAMD